MNKSEIEHSILKTLNLPEWEVTPEIKKLADLFIQLSNDRFEQGKQAGAAKHFEELFEEIKHGDQEHQDWLKEKLITFASNYKEWKRFEEEKPSIGIEVLAYSKDWIHEDYNPKGIRIGFLNEDENGPFISAVYDNCSDCYETDEETKPEKWKSILNGLKEEE